MSQPIVLLEYNKHADLKVKAVDYSYMANQHIVPVTLHEFGRAAVEYPIVFVKNSDNGSFQPVAMMSLKPEQNTSIIDGRWTGLYMPNVVRDYPLGLVLNPEEQGKVWIGIREGSEALSTEEGAPLFNDTKETEYLEARKKALIEHYQQDQATQALVARLVELDLLVQQNLKVEVKGEPRNINGLYLINEEKLNKLTEEEFKELRERGLIGPIYSHLTSLGQINRLARAEANA